MHACYTFSILTIFLLPNRIVPYTLTRRDFHFLETNVNVIAPAIHVYF